MVLRRGARTAPARGGKKKGRTPSPKGRGGKKSISPKKLRNSGSTTANVATAPAAQAHTEVTADAAGTAKVSIRASAEHGAPPQPLTPAQLTG